MSSSGSAEVPDGLGFLILFEVLPVVFPFCAPAQLDLENLEAPEETER